ncbi:MAG: LysR family transcriptional regulator [Herbaspirillum sp.]|jgi:LysR family pca operon transcriptional activator|nr:LysR family transcriptional regulator [Herbaspirillum sp.]
MINGRIKFRHLQCFLVVARQRSLQKAAQTLSITQPAVSKTIKELEDILRVRLFDRSRKETVLTRQGEIFFVHAEASVSALQQGTNSMMQGGDAIDPIIRIGTTPTLAASFLTQVLQVFRSRVANIQASILTSTTSHLMEQLRDRKFDLVLCRHCDPEQMVGLSFEYLFADPLVMVVRPEHPLLKASSTSMSDWRLYTAVLPVKGSVNRHAADTFATAQGLGPVTDFIESLSIFFGRSYTANTDAIWFVPWGVVKHDVASGFFVKLSLPLNNNDASDGSTARPTGLMMQANNILTPGLQTLINVIRECASARRGEVF